MRIWLRKDAVPADASHVATVKLGGISLFGRTQDELEDQIKLGCDTIANCARDHLLITRDVLRHLCKSQDSSLEQKRLFSALLGKCLRQGVIDSLTCSTTGFKTYWILCHNTQLAKLDSILKYSCDAAFRNGSVTISDVRNVYFPDKAWGTWSSIQHVLGRAVYLGLLKPIDEKSYSLPQGLDDAIRNDKLVLAAVQHGRLGPAI